MHKAAAHAKRGLPLRHLPAMDLPFLVLVLTLVGFGLVMLGSASSAVALYRRGDAFAYLRPQLLYAALGIGAMWVASRVDYHVYHKLAWPLLALSMVLLTAVLFMPEYNGCKRWLVLPGLGTLQPSEIAKFAVVLVFAHIIALNHDRMGSFAVGVLPFALVLGAVAVLMLLEPHLSGTVLILGIGAVLMFVGGTGLKWFVLAGAGGAAAIGAAIIIMPDLVPYAASRLSSWLDPFADPLGDGHQTIQSLYNCFVSEFERFADWFTLDHFSSHRAGSDCSAAAEGFEFNVGDDIFFDLQIDFHDIAAGSVAYLADTICVSDFADIAWIGKMVPYFIRIHHSSIILSFQKISKC